MQNFEGGTPETEEKPDEEKTVEELFDLSTVKDPSKKTCSEKFTDLSLKVKYQYIVSFGSVLAKKQMDIELKPIL